MSIPALSIKRPVTVFMITCIVLVFGVVSLSKLPVELYSNTSFGEISIIINVRGSIPPTEVESQVTRLVEDAVSSVTDLQQLLSISKEGESTVVLSFNPGTDMSFAALEVREKFAKIKNKLPKDIEKPVIAEFKQGDVAVVTVAVTSEQRSTEQIRKIVDDNLKEGFKRVPGVANVEVAGGRERKILVEGDQTRLAALGISLDEVTGILGGNNLNLLSGQINRSDNFFLIRTIGEFDSIDRIREMPIRRTPEGSVIRVKDVASVKDSYLEPSEISRLNVKPVVTLYVQKESTKNTITVVKGILDEIERAKTKVPADIHLVVTSNQAEFIKKAIDNLQESLLQGIVLIILVFFLFLFKLDRKRFLFVIGLLVLALFCKGWPLLVLFVLVLGTLIVVPKFRSIIIMTVPIPVSIVGVFIFMRMMNLSVNVMTLFGLALGAGMLVDNSIVVFENILKKREGGDTIVNSAISGSEEMYLTIIAATLASIIVFLPLAFMGQELQKLYSGMALTVVLSLLMSVACAVGLVPMMCSRPSFVAGFDIESETNAHHDKNSFGYKFAKVERRFLFRSIRNRKWVVLACAVVVTVSFYFLSRLGTEYLGSTEQNKFTVHIEMPTGVRLEANDKVVKKVEQVVKKIPEVKTQSSRIEGWSSKIYVELVKASERKRTVKDIEEIIRKDTDKLRPAFVYFQEEEQVGTKEIVIEVFGFQYEKLRQVAIAIANKLGTVKGLSDTKIRMREGRPEMQVLVNKKKAGTYDLSVGDVANQIHGQMRGLRATAYHTEGKEVETISRLDEKYRKTFKDLHRLILSNGDQDQILLDQVADFKFGLGPSEIWRKDKYRMIQVSANVGKIPLSKLVDQVNLKLKDIPFPEDYFYKVGGDYPTLVKTNQQIRLMVLIDLFLVYIVLASLFESLYQPVLIMIAVPLALTGAVVALYLGPRTVGVGAMLGMMMLSGIVVNHSIMLLDRINYYRKRGNAAVRAAILANKDRLRPILMTTSCTTLGLLPMAIDKTEGANLWSPLALTVIGGILSSTLLSLMVTPALYIVSQDIIRFGRSPGAFSIDGLGGLRQEAGKMLARFRMRPPTKIKPPEKP